MAVRSKEMENTRNGQPKYRYWQSRPADLLLFAICVALVVDCKNSFSEQPDAGLECPDGSVEKEDACLFGCPDGWERNADGYCSPPCLQGWSEIDGVCALPCPDGLEPFEGGLLCRPPEEEVGPRPCTDGDYDISGAEDAEQIIYVNAATGSAAGDGSQSAPFQTVEQALGAVEPTAAEVAIALAAGEYHVENWEAPSLILPDRVHVLGICAYETEIVSPGSLWLINQSYSIINLARVTLMAEGVSLLEIRGWGVRDCRILGELSWTTSGEGEFLNVERNLFVVPEADTNCISVFGSGDPAISIAGNLFQDCGSDSISINGLAELDVRENWFLLSGAQNAIRNGTSGEDESITFVRNWVDGGTAQALYFNGWQGPIVLEELSFSNLSGPAVTAEGLQEVSISNIRSQVGEDGITTHVYVYNSTDVVVDGLTAFGGTDTCVEIVGSAAVHFGATCLQDCGNSALEVLDSTNVRVEDSVVRGSGNGIDAFGSGVAVTNTAIGANDGVGIKARMASGLTVESSVIAGNASTGIDFTSLADGIFEVTDCDIYDNTGLGILVRSGGDADVKLTNNRIVGTRPGTVQNAQGQGSVGDGIAVLTGTDNVPSHATLQGNTVRGNARLGIIAHGSGTTMTCSETTFGAGNGYDGYVSSLTSDGTADLIQQAGAQVNGASAQEPDEDLFVEANPGGGDPH